MRRGAGALRYPGAGRGSALLRVSDPRPVLRGKPCQPKRRKRGCESKPVKKAGAR